MESPVSAPNGIGWSLDNSTVYFTDTKQGTIYQYKFEPSTGAISSHETFINFPQQQEKYVRVHLMVWRLIQMGICGLQCLAATTCCTLTGKQRSQRGRLSFQPASRLHAPDLSPGFAHHYWKACPLRPAMWKK
ncbi:hypothetical protein BDZ91DRAFT_280933 [Kalaharituber pfeilii]|nr:hypothetical protein BDZ91DRAFT_280933 [Kalaharituber pfeilii]